ncbi:MAG: hypothetical protein EZS28_028006, partial [Streblomastix strix]
TQLIDSYSKSETYARDEVYLKGETNNLLNYKADTGVSYTKCEDDALLLLKADKIQLIDSNSKSETYARDEVYTKGEINNLLNYKADTGVSYTKCEDDALLLLKVDKSTTYSKSETYARDEVYTKGETNNLLNNNANQSTTYMKTETDYLLSQIDVGDVDLTDYYNKTKTDELLGEKADAAELSNYITLDSSQTINANKTFNNACRFISTIDGMSTVTSATFAKSGSDDTVVLLGADQPYPEPTDDDYVTFGAVKSEFVSSIYSGSINGNLTATQFIKSDGTDQQILLVNGTTKPLSEFASGNIDDSNDVKKTGKQFQIIHVVLRRDDEELSMSENDEDYLTRGEIYNAFVSRYDNQTIFGTKTFNSNVKTDGFANTGKDDISVLLAGGGDRLLSSFGGIEDLASSAFSGLNDAIIQYKLIRIGSLYIFTLLDNGGKYNMGTFNPDYLVQDDVALITYIQFPNNTEDKGGYVSITHSTGLITFKSTTNTYIQCASATWVK